MSIADLTCRRPAPHEAQALCALIRRIVSASFPMFPRAALDAYFAPWTSELVEKRLAQPKDVLLGVYAGSEMIGLTSGTAPEGGVGTIVWLLVDAPARGKGAGNVLYSAACDAYRALGAHKMKLTAPSHEARAFYERCGMEVEGRHPNHWYNVDFTAMAVFL